MIEFGIHAFTNVIDRCIAHVAPCLCVNCGREGAVMCSLCLLAAGEPPEPCCFVCGTPSAGSVTCTSCCSSTDLHAVYIATEFAGIYRRLIHEFKFNLRRQAAEQIAQIMRPAVGSFGGEPFIVCPIPTAPARIRSRGFDHLRQLTNALMRLLQSDSGPPPSQIRCLRRRTNSRQLGASRDQRAAQAAEEFVVVNHSAAAGANVMLVDDVATTGATLKACAKVLTEAGAVRVSAVVFARKI